MTDRANAYQSPGKTGARNLPTIPRLPLRGIDNNPSFKRQLVQSFRAQAIIPRLPFPDEHRLGQLPSTERNKASSVCPKRIMANSATSRPDPRPLKLAPISSAWHDPTQIEPFLTLLGDDAQDLVCQSGCKQVYFICNAEAHHQVANKASKADPSQLAEATYAYERWAKNGEDVKRWTDNWAVHWANGNAEQYTDAELTDDGRRQCDSYRDRAQQLGVELVIVSPLRRTLETAQRLFGPRPTHIDTDTNSCTSFAGCLLVHDLCRETFGEFTCDMRFPLDKNRNFKPNCADSCPFWNVWDWAEQETSPSNFDRKCIGYGHNNSDSVWTQERESPEHLQMRIKLFLRWLLVSRTETKIAVVTHSSFLKHMFKMYNVNAEVHAEHSKPMATLLRPILTF